MVREKLKGFGRDVVVYGVGDALGRMIGLIMLPILSRIFGPADYGAIELLNVGYAFTLMFVRLGIDTGVQRYYYRSEGDERRRMVTSCFVYLIGIDVLVAGGLFLAATPLARVIGGPLEVVATSVRLLALILVVEQVWAYLILLLRLNRRAAAFSATNIALVILTPSFTYAFVVGLDTGFVGVFMAKGAALVAVTLGLIGLTRREFIAAVDGAVFRKVFLFAIPGHPGLMVTNALNLVPRYLLAAFVPLSEVGLFGIAMKVSSVMRVAIQAFNRAWNPFAYKNEGADDEARTYELVFKGFLSFVVVLVTTLAVLAREVLDVLTPDAYDTAWRLVPWIVVSIGLDGLVLIFSTILYTRDRVVWTTWFGVGRLLLFLILGFALVPNFEAMGLTWALAITSAIHIVVYGVAALRLFGFHVPVARVVIVLVLAGSGVAGVLSLDLDLAARLGAKLLTIAVVAMATGALLLSRDELARVRRLVRRSP